MTTSAERPDGPVFDLLDPSWSINPYLLYADLRERAPILKSELGFWVLARHADCLAVIRDRRASSDNLHAEQGSIPEGIRRPVAPDSPEAIGLGAMRPFLFRDPPDHTRLRGLVAKAFTPRVIDALSQRVQQATDDLIDTALDTGRVDLLRMFAYPLPVRIICELLGVPVEDQSKFGKWSEAMAKGLDPDFLLSDEIIAERGAATLEVIRYFFALVAERKVTPGDDLLSLLIEVEADGDVLSETELISTMILLLFAGHETTVNLIAGGTLALLQHPDQLERFRREPSLERPAIEEMMRYVAPIQMVPRTITEDCSIAETAFRAGDFVLLLIGSANRDESVFSHGEHFDITRNPNNHLGLGFGIHHCIGAPLARMQTRIALSTLMRRAPNLALDGDELHYKPNIILRGLEALPVSMHG
jgi:cytochrome P450